ncbi:hypothetical protein [Streptomyces carpinensis]|uniref:Transposase n=1 Tax=Streptomyces carpinensis TaxID=66369 RepID=A0ABV1VV13_9ACTN|nr:hypothetical protein [Streptomyces carpinensis]
MKALVAVEHSMIVAIWHMLTTNQPYHDLGGQYFAQLDLERAARRAITQLGYTVSPEAQRRSVRHWAASHAHTHSDQVVFTRQSAGRRWSG